MPATTLLPITRDTWHARAPLVTSVLLGAALAARAVAVFVPHGEAIAPASAAAGQGDRPSAVDVDAILRARMFGGHAGASAADGPEPGHYRLLGLVRASIDSLSRAILAYGSTPAGVYALGGRLPGGETLVEVGDKWIVIERRGARATVGLPRIGGGQWSGPATPATAGDEAVPRHKFDVVTTVDGQLIRHPDYDPNEIEYPCALPPGRYSPVEEEQIQREVREGIGQCPATRPEDWNSPD